MSHQNSCCVVVAYWCDSSSWTRARFGCLTDEVPLQTLTDEWKHAGRCRSHTEVRGNSVTVMESEKENRKCIPPSVHRNVRLW